MDDRYGSDVLGGNWRRTNRQVPRVPARIGEVFEDNESGYVGAVVGVDSNYVELENRQGRVRTFPLGHGFLHEGRHVELVAPKHERQPVPQRTASGGRKGPKIAAQTAKASRIYVEGRHDAELVEKIWGEDLREQAITVEYIEGIDDLSDTVRDFAPSPQRRLGILVDHLVPGTKEFKIVHEVNTGPFGEHVLIVGHPYVDVWQAVKPDRLGLASWPVIPPHLPWKQNICRALGWPYTTQTDIARAWKTILSRVNSYTDLEPALLGRVEELIDFVMEGH